MRRFPRFTRRFSPSSRNYEDPQYKEWRKLVLARDKRKCQYPGCDCHKGLQVHHILGWSEYPALRFNIQNGITLCYQHHKLVNGNESAYVKIFTDILIKKLKENL